MKRTWTIIGVGDVPASFKWYQAIFGQPQTPPSHDHFGQILDTDGTVLLCLHRWGAHEHPSLMSPDEAPPGNGLLLFFRVDDFDMAFKRARALVTPLEEEPHVNPNTRTREFSLRDPDGYYVTISALSAPRPAKTRPIKALQPTSRARRARSTSKKPSRATRAERRSLDRLHVGHQLVTNGAQGMRAKPRIKTQSIDEYLAALSDDKRAVLERLRKTIRAAVPKAEECISYGLPAFRLNGRPLVAFGASETHCAFFPMSGITVEAHKHELKDYRTSKGTIRFQADSPLPASLVRKLVEARIAENAVQQRHAADGATRRR